MSLSLALLMPLVLVLSRAEAQAARHPANVSPNTPASAPAPDFVKRKLQEALENFLPQLGTLEPWQTKLFQEEVLPESIRFVRDYRTRGNGLSVDIDSESIRDYLRFYGPKTLKRQKTEVFLVLRPEPGCELCAKNLAPIQKLVRERLERRGLLIVTPTAEQVDPKLSGESLNEAALRQASQLKYPVSLVVEWTRSHDDVDSAHADELRFDVRAALVIRDLAKEEGELEIFDTGSFEKAVGKLLTDFFTGVGTQLERAPVQVVDAERNGYALEITGVRDFAHYSALKNLVLGMSSAPGHENGTVIEEQKLSRGKVIFSIYTDKTLDAVKSEFAKLDLKDAASVDVRMEIR